MKISEEQLRAVVALPAEVRYEHFIKRVADTEEVWILDEDGWAMASNADGTQILPVWSAFEYADMCRRGEWENYRPASIELEELLNGVLPDLAENGILIAVSYLPKDEGVVVDSNRLSLDIERELQNY